MKRILVTGKNCEISREVFSRDARLGSYCRRRQDDPHHSGMQPESAAGGTRAPYTPLQVAPSSVPYPPALGVTLAETLLYGVLFFGAGFGLAWSFPA